MPNCQLQRKLKCKRCMKGAPRAPCCLIDSVAILSSRKCSSPFRESNLIEIIYNSCTSALAQYTRLIPNHRSQNTPICQPRIAPLEFPSPSSSTSYLRPSTPTAPHHPISQPTLPHSQPTLPDSQPTKPHPQPIKAPTPSSPPP